MRTLLLASAWALALVLSGPLVLAANDGPALTRVAYTDSHIPDLSCSTVYGCEVILQVGERLRLASLTDDRWTARVADSGSPTTAPRILIAPTVADEPALDGPGRQTLRTAMHVLTDRREYVIDLRATGRAEQHRLGFTYDDAPAVVVRRFDPVDLATSAPTASPAIEPQAETPPLDPARMDFGWRVTGDAALRCVAAFSYGSQLWCKLPIDQPRVPSAYLVDGPKDLPLNAHVVAERYLVVDSVTGPVDLILGGAKQLKSRIARVRE